VKKDQELQFSYVGFETQILSIEKNQPVNISMVMDEMVLGGYIGVVVTHEYRGSNLSNAKYVVEPEEYPESEYTLYTAEQRKQWRENNKKAQANELAFKRIQQARKKAARTLRKSKRKKK
jgi:membrane glycosyltransferase